MRKCPSRAVVARQRKPLSPIGVVFLDFRQHAPVMGYFFVQVKVAPPTSPFEILSEFVSGAIAQLVGHSLLRSLVLTYSLSSTLQHGDTSL